MEQVFDEGKYEEKRDGKGRCEEPVMDERLDRAVYPDYSSELSAIRPP